MLDPTQKDIGGDRRIGTGEARMIGALLLAFWLAFQVVFYVYYALSEGGALRLATLPLDILRFVLRPIELLAVGAGVALCVAIYGLLRWVRDRSAWIQLALGVGAALVGALLFSGVVRLLLDAFGLPQAPASGASLALEVTRWIAPFGLWAAISLALVYALQVRDREARLARLAAQAHEAQMRALRYQINPHFLHNTLNSIAALILDHRNDMAESMVVRLSEFFRASLAIDPLDDVPLSKEFALQRLYLDIETLRFDNLVVRIDLPAELRDALVPSLILQPLVENALKYGVNDPPARTELTISARQAGERLVLEVSDNGPGASNQSGGGVGLDNVGRRLATHFGPEAGLEVLAQDDPGFRVRLTLPLHRGPGRR